MAIFQVNLYTKLNNNNHYYTKTQGASSFKSLRYLDNTHCHQATIDAWLFYQLTFLSGSKV